MFQISKDKISRDDLAILLQNSSAGAYVSFEGWVRNHNAGREVASLEYEIYPELALSQGKLIITEAKNKFKIADAHCIHRYGHLNINELAIWIGVTATHRDDAYRASRYIIDQIKYRLPVWKKEYYINGEADWVFCRDHHHHISFDEEKYYSSQKTLIQYQDLKNKNVLVVGAGGLGCPVLVALTGAGVGQITIVDQDKVSVENLHRQYLYQYDSVGKYKSEEALCFLKKMNPFIKFQHYSKKVQEVQFAKYDLVIDCTDNLEAKLYLHDLCFQKKIPLVSAAIYKMQGQVRSFLMHKNEGCWRCACDSDQGALGDYYLKSCDNVGVTTTITNYIGSIQANEALEYLLNQKNNTSEYSLFLDLKNLSQMKIKNHHQPNCTTCSLIFKGNIEVRSFELNDSIMSSDLLIWDVSQINVEEEQLLEQKLKQQKKIVLKCSRGIQSKSLAKYFRSKGYDTVYYLSSNP